MLEPEYEIIQAVPKIIGYNPEPIFVLPENESTFFSHARDEQGTIPGRSIEEIKKELGII